jgi:DNA-binding beta-propeller fold protein YncE
MTTVAASGTMEFEAVAPWGRLPEGMRLHETPGVAVGPDGMVYALTRNTDNPLIVFDRDGAFVTTFGKGVFTDRTHGIIVGPDGNLYCTDDGSHTVTKWSTEGHLLQTIGTPGQPSPRWSGLPFCRPTQAAVSHRTGHIYVSDGYANARVHQFTPDGTLLRSWGSPGIDAGQFMIPHNIAIDPQDRVYVADREAHRVQVFDGEGNFLAMWNNIHRPCGLTVGPDGNIYIGELNGVSLTQDCPGYGHRISVLSPEGKLLARFGDPEEGEEPGRFIAPHGISVDAQGDVYVGEVSYTIRGQTMNPPRELRSLSKLRRTTARS